MVGRLARNSSPAVSEKAEHLALPMPCSATTTPYKYQYVSCGDHKVILAPVARYFYCTILCMLALAVWLAVHARTVTPVTIIILPTCIDLPNLNGWFSLEADNYPATASGSYW